MKALKAADLAELSIEDLKAKLAELTEEQFRLRFRTATEAIENPIQFRQRRRDIARIKTVLRQREMGR
ncbi:MAG: 50S ribosomal protein L29 [Gemmatimonadetes bacterium]|nr:50S ribosomal protein L29 [Gemmatimonadota bacterium]MCC7132300.1 50S ribosomal protein L29 [Gemmatimonadales bacterium]